jgi:formylglycine-generating enzyme required for sulfatase activity
MAGLTLVAAGAERAALPPVNEPLRTGVSAVNDAALVIGIEEYPMMPAGAKTVPFASRDAEAFRTWLVYTRGVPYDKVKVLGNGAKRGQIEAEARRVAELGRGGTVWLYFSGHGSADSNRPEVRLVLPADADASAEPLRDDASDLDALHGLLASEGSRVGSVVDACSTGTAKRSDVRVAPTSKSFLLAEATWTSVSSKVRGAEQLTESSARAPYAKLLEGYLTTWRSRTAQVVAQAWRVSEGGETHAVTLPASTKAVVAPEVALAVSALAKVKAAPSAVEGPVSGGAAASCGSWSGGQGCRVARVPRGTFTMGSPTSETGRSSDEAQVSVTLTRDFLLMTTEVTQGLYQAVTGKNPSYFTSCGAKCPVERVSWLDAVAFANALSVKDGLAPAYGISGTTVTANWGANGWRLPTEAEWERAARGGQRTVYAGGNELDDVGWYDGNSGSTTHAVCTKKPNAYGLCDMSGNVWEWTWDGYAESRAGGKDPAGPSSGSNRVYRGGSWSDEPTYARVAYRIRLTPGYAYDYLGFRLARSAP